MLSGVWKLLGMIGIHRGDEDLAPIPDADPDLNKTPDSINGKTVSPIRSAAKKHVTFSPKPENIPLYDLVHDAKPAGATPIRLMRECAARASPQINGELTSRINDLEQLIADMKCENEALVAENKRLNAENRILHSEKQRLHSSTASG